MVVVLLHSPLVGPYTWSPVADELTVRGVRTVIPTLSDQDDTKRPYWRQHASAAAQSLAGLAGDVPLVLTGHSGAGPLLPAIRWAIGRPVAAYLFVDAGIPHDGASRLELMGEESAEWAAQFRQYLAEGGRFPNWREAELADILPDQAVRQRLVAEIRPRGLPFFTEPLPVFEGWPDAPGAYLLFSETYRASAKQAQRRGWPLLEIPAGHFHMLVEPAAVADALLQLVEQIRP